MSSLAGTQLPILFKSVRGGVMSWQIGVLPQDDGTAVVRRRFGRVGGAMQEQDAHITQGKNHGKANATTPIVQALNEAQSEWNKQLTRKGYSEDPTGQESAAKRAAAPMLAKEFGTKKGQISKIDFEHAVGQPKCDGYRCLARKIDGRLSLTSREGKPFTTLLHLEEVLHRILPEGETLDGELFNPEVPFQKIASAIRRQQELTAAVQLHVYDVVNPGAYRDRMLLLDDLVGDGVDQIRRVTTVPITSAAQLLEYERDCVAEGYEGAMLRYGDAGYEPGRRSPTLLKVKTMQDAEFEIVGVREGAGTHAGCAVFECHIPATGGTFTVTAPGQMPAKRAAWDNRDSFIGKQLTVKFFEWTTSGDIKPRMPVALRIKEDV